MIHWDWLVTAFVGWLLFNLIHALAFVFQQLTPFTIELVRAMSPFGADVLDLLMPEPQAPHEVMFSYAPPTSPTETRVCTHDPNTCDLHQCEFPKCNQGGTDGAA